MQYKLPSPASQSVQPFRGAVSLKVQIVIDSRWPYHIPVGRGQLSLSRVSIWIDDVDNAVSTAFNQGAGKLKVFYQLLLYNHNINNVTR